MVHGEEFPLFFNVEFNIFLFFREPRSKIRHQGFHPFAFGPRFPSDPLMGGIQFKLGKIDARWFINKWKLLPTPNSHDDNDSARMEFWRMLNRNLDVWRVVEFLRQGFGVAKAYFFHVLRVPRSMWRGTWRYFNFNFNRAKKLFFKRRPQQLSCTAALYDEHSEENSFVGKIVCYVTSISSKVPQSAAMTPRARASPK